MHSKVLFLPVLILIILFNNTPVAAQSEAGDEGPIYIIQEGDTFWSIAKRFNVTVEELLAANPDIDPGLLAVGQQIKIPGLEGVNGILHSETVGFGETFRSLSRRTQVPDATFRKLNRLVSPAELYLGTNLIIPQPDTQVGLSTRSSLKAGETLLELAVKQNSDPWTLVDANNIKATWAALPGDILYSPTGTPDETATGLPSIFSSVEVGSLPLTQGRTARVRLQVEAGAQVSGTLVDHDLQFFQEEDSSFIALQGIHAMLEPGIYPLRLTAALPDGSQQSFEQMVLVVSGNYLDEVIPVHADTINPTVDKAEDEWLLSRTTQVTPERYWNGLFLRPSTFPDVSSWFGTRRLYIATEDPNITKTGFHSGIDYIGGEGLPITAPAAGKVIFTGLKDIRGYSTIIDHGQGVYSGFWHQSEIQVQPGDFVEAGQQIGLVGGTGRSTGAHQHWEIWVNGVQVNPLEWLEKTFP